MGIDLGGVYIYTKRWTIINRPVVFHVTRFSEFQSPVFSLPLRRGLSILVGLKWFPSHIKANMACSEGGQCVEGGHEGHFTPNDTQVTIINFVSGFEKRGNCSRKMSSVYQ